MMASLILQCLRSRIASAVCLAVVAAALLLPGEGPGIPLCQFKNLTGLPCLGCGLTRSFIGMADLDFARAGFYHPVGVLLFPLVLLVAALLPLPRSRRERLVGWAAGHARALNLYGAGLLAVFMLYGVGRIAWLILTARSSPW